jgi:thioredoxin 1
MLMKKVFMIFSILALFSSELFAHEHINSVAEYERLTQNGNVIIDFYASWCIPCQQLGYNIEKLNIDTENVKIYKVNVDENPELQAIYSKTEAIPALLFIKDGRVIDKQMGSQTTAELEDEISRYFY